MELEDNQQNTAQAKQWFVLRDFKKRNAKSPGYKVLAELGIQCFTPMHWVVSTRLGKRIREYVPVIQNLLFAYETKEALEPLVATDRTLQFQFKRGCGSASPMIVPVDEMNRFINAVNNDPSPVYYTPEELTPDKIGKSIIVEGGPLNGYRGVLLKMQGSKKRRLIIKIEGLMAVAVEINPDYIRFI